MEVFCHLRLPSPKGVLVGTGSPFLRFFRHRRNSSKTIKIVMKINPAAISPYKSGPSTAHGLLKYYFDLLHSFSSFLHHTLRTTSCAIGYGIFGL